MGYSLREENEFQIDVDELEDKVTEKTKMMVILDPSNPTGSIQKKETLKKVAQFAVKHDLLVVSDEIYEKIIYDGNKHYSIAAFPGMRERTIVLNGFAKAYAMTGWRVGYACGHSDIIDAMINIHSYSIMCASIMGQKTALEALRYGEHEMRKMVESYNYRRRIILAGFDDIGMNCFEPKGAFYCFPSIRCTGMSSEEFCEKLLEEEKVAVVPGNAFGACGEGFVRCCYAANVNHIEEAVSRMGNFLNRHRK